MGRARGLNLAWPVLAAGILTIVGYGPMRRAQGADGVNAMLAGVGLVLAVVVASMWLAARRMVDQDAAARFRTVLAVGVFRFLLTVAAATVVAWRQIVAPGAFLIWTGGAYVIITLVETLALLHWSRRLERSDD
jgi:hypothetical protein